uniref:Uncharacterized protein n=1 Tax=Latilactobacillus sakei TaxID=1599 RepID=A0A8F1IGD3_LATSK|nr:hypothetical protein [Latilactobacillus sakei]
MTEKKRITVSFTDTVSNDLERLVKESGLSKSGLLTVLIRDEIERKENDQKK